MRGELPPVLIARAQSTLSRKLLDRIVANPSEQIPAETWQKLDPQCRSMVLQLTRLAKDGFDLSPLESDKSKAQRQLAAPTWHAGVDPITAASGPDPKTGLDPTALEELFGDMVDTTGLEKLEGQALVNELKSRFFSLHVPLGYDNARTQLFTVVDNHDGRVKDVYTGRIVEGVESIPEQTGPNALNVEHTVPQSRLKEAGARGALADLHHLFPVGSLANKWRGALPFGVVVKDVAWEEGGTRVGCDASGQRVCELSKAHRGDAARATFWVSVAYGITLPADEEAVLHEWAKEDPVDDGERARNKRVASVQGDLNPFVEMPELLDKIRGF